MKAVKEHVAFAFKHPETDEINIPQCQFYDTVMKAVAGLNKHRFFFYGGAIRGGKTYVCLYILVVLARLFPKSRWHIFRSDFPELEDTTIPSMEKLLGAEGRDFIWKRKPSNYHVVFSNGSKIFFKSENLARDPELKWMLGLETNGIFLEQMEGVSETLFGRAIERLGSWYIAPNMPPPLLFGTFNPTDTWVKKKLYDKWHNPDKYGPLPDNWFYQEALPSDNPFVTSDQWKNWNNLDPISYNQLIKSVWKFMNDAKLFAYSFDEEKHVVDVTKEEGKKIMEPNRALPLKLIFDFNVDPMTCLVAQNNQLSSARIIAEYRLRDSDIFEVLARIKSDWIAAGYFVVATGDASGRARQGAVKGKRSYIQILKSELDLSSNQLQFPKKNPSVADSRIVMNSVFHRHPDFKISSACQFLIDDLSTVKVDDEGDIDKKSDKLKTHLLDNCRYFMWNYLRKFVNM
jgi:hypothetical protein